MPGHIGTSIVFNSGSYFGRDPKELTDEQVADLRARFEAQGLDVPTASDEDLRNGMLAMAEGFRDNAPTTAAEAATIILDGVRAGEWRILVGDDAQVLDEAVRPTRSTPTSPSSWSACAKGVFGGMPVAGARPRAAGRPVSGATGSAIAVASERGVGRARPAGAGPGRRAASPSRRATSISAAATR